MIVEVGDKLVSMEIFTEKFCCDISKCNGECCIEGDAGAPVTTEEVAEIENVLDVVWSDLSAQAQSVIDKQGVAYVDEEGDLVTSIVNGKDCVFTCYEDICGTGTPCCLCAIEKAQRAGKIDFIKPISCALYPIRVSEFKNGTIALNYNRWKVCKSAVEKGEKENIPIYKFLEGPLTRRFGKEWYNLLLEVAECMKKEGYIKD